MAKSVVKLISYIIVEHANGTDPRLVNEVVRTELGDDFKTILNQIEFKNSFIQAVSSRLNFPCKFQLLSETALLKKINEIPE
jgi:hypothetical protein